MPVKFQVQFRFVVEVCENSLSEFMLNIRLKKKKQENEKLETWTNIPFGNKDLHQ